MKTTVFPKLMENIITGNINENLSCKLLTHDQKSWPKSDISRWVESKKLKNVSWENEYTGDGFMNMKIIADDIIWSSADEKINVKFAVIYDTVTDEPLICYDFERIFSLMDGDTLTLRFPDTAIYKAENTYNPSKKIEKIILPEELFDI